MLLHFPCSASQNALSLESVSQDFGSMRYLLKILPVIALVFLGLPAAANAHGGFDDDGVRAAPITVSDVKFDHSAEASSDAKTIVEASNSELPQKRCVGPCCTQGMSHCSSSCGAPSALNGRDAIIVFDDTFASKLRPHGSSIASLDRKFGLERPPRG
jgi:hypothetical protein